MNKILVIIIVLVILSAGIFGYLQITKKPEAPEKKLSTVLNVYNWEDYFGETTLEDFEKEFGVDVNLEIYEDEEMMLSAVQSDPTKYDIIIASDDLVWSMTEMKLLAEIDYENIPNFKNIGDKHKNPSYDPGNKRSVPYTLWTTAIAVNRKYIEETEDSWSILWNPKYKGKISMLNNSYEVIGAALKYLGYPLCSTDPAQLEEAKQLLLEQKPLLRGGYEDCITIREDLISEELWAAHEYSGEGCYAADENENIEYIIPKEGGSYGVDTLAIPVGSPHKYTAEVFINYLLDPKVNADISNYLWYASPNEAAREFTNPEILEDPSLYPSEEVLKKCEIFTDIGEADAIYHQIWAELQRSD
ncbi:hypothetical protein AMJ49_00405 [Parcubacteria bacterium DG_74_2]|nr:MAG: hypothetical protein AMJ49_00405 [Parcubacteria bacterium DG_74_2]